MKISPFVISLVFIVVASVVLSVLILGCDEDSSPSNPTSSWSSSCSCTSNQYNCDDFLSSADAQLCFEHCVALGADDIHDLDRDNDNAACEDWGY